MTISRRTFVGLAGAATAAAALPAEAAHPDRGLGSRQGVEPWTAYFGAVRHSPAWGRFRRDGFLYTDGELDAAELTGYLQDHAVLVGGVGRGIGIHSTQDEVNAYMDGLLADSGASFRGMAQQNVTRIMQVSQDAANPVLGIQLGNEINSTNYSITLRAWAEHANKPYPHPRSDHDDPAGANDRGYIGYWVEYVLGPSIEAIQDALAGFPPERQIKIMCGSLANARNPFARTEWLEALLNYVIHGHLAPTLAGRRVRDLVDYLSIHYLLTSDPLGSETWRPALTELHDTWVGTGSISGIWHTEEGGGQAEVLGQHASVSHRVFARITDWALDRGASPDVVRVAAYYEANNPPETSYDDGMTELLNFLGPDALLVNRSDGVSAQADNDVETYGFETSDGSKRALFVTPVRKGTSAQGPTNVTAITMQADGWTAPGDAIGVQTHLFRTAANGHDTVEVTVDRHPQTGGYMINLPEPIDLNADNGGATLTTYLTK